MRHDRILFLALAALLAIAPAAAAQATDVTGTWTATFVTNGQSHPATLVLKVDGEKATGTISSERGETTVTGAVTGQTVTLAFTTAGDNGPLPIAMKGSADGDAMKGTFDYGAGTGTWSATRNAAASGGAPEEQTPAATADVTGTWTFTVTLPNLTASPTIVFKQAGDALTGEYQSTQYGKFPLNGTVKGNAIEFEFEMTIEGTTLNVSYGGTIDKDTMKGDVSYGGLADGTFTAQRAK
jgi:hypothetical protein